MPAAAVIPAPRAYTNIAAVKTLVVGPWVQVCRLAGAGSAAIVPSGVVRSSPGAGTQPPAVRSCTRSQDGVNRSRPQRAPFTGGHQHGLLNAPDAGQDPRMGCGRVPLHARAAPGPPPEPALAVTVENSVCSRHPVLAGCSSMECQSIDRMWPNGVVLALVPILGNCGGRPLRVVGGSVVAPLRPRSRASRWTPVTSRTRWGRSG